MNDKALIKMLSQGYCTNKENLCLAIGFISNNATQKIYLGNNASELEESTQSYEIGSITKTFMSTIYLNLLKEHKISLDDKIIDNVTISQALTHTSGIGEIPFVSTPSNPNGYIQYSKADVLNYIQSIKISPQKSWDYSNLGFALTGIYLEKLLNQPLADIIDNYIKNDLNLSHTKIGYDRCSLTGYNYNNQPTNWLWQKNSSLIPAGGLISTLDDMLQYLKSQLKTVEEICQNTYIKTDMPFDMSLAWMIEKETSSIFCMGLTGGFSSFIGLNHSTQKGIIILSNYCSQGYGIKDTPNQIGLGYLKHP